MLRCACCAVHAGALICNLGQDEAYCTGCEKRYSRVDPFIWPGCDRFIPTFALQDEAYRVREDVIRAALSERFRTNAEQAGVALDMKSSGKLELQL